MPNVHDDDEESLLFADESEWMDDEHDERCCMNGVQPAKGPHPACPGPF